MHKRGILVQRAVSKAEPKPKMPIQAQGPPIVQGEVLGALVVVVVMVSRGGGCERQSVHGVELGKATRPRKQSLKHRVSCGK